MPFIGRDWRSPGEAWVKTEGLGWQRMKIIESQLHPSCHQIPACSWPPRSEFGQHMANNCQYNTIQFRDSLSSGSSSDSSHSGSISTSPTGSPERNIHQLYPITISSPYGQYSCCVHHLESGLPKAPNCFESATDNSHLTAQRISQSLSHETLRDEDGDDSNVNNQQIRYNRSVSDLRASSLPESSSREKKHNFPMAESLSGNRNSPRLIENRPKTGEQEPKNDSLNQNESKEITGCCCTGNKRPPSLFQPKEPYVRAAPHCRISVRTREVAMYNTISEAFYRLDFCNAIHDIRRFNYICKLLHLLITENLTSLSGCATKVLFTMLEQVAWEVSSNKRNIHVLKNLLNELKQMIQKYYCWGRPIGSSLLWQQHFDTIERISQIVDGIELSPPKNEGTQITFDNLPVEMIREILLRLNDYRDLVNSAQASPVMRSMINGQYIWQQLCRYHFSEQQLKLAFDDRLGMLAKKGSVRGVKYARTSSADGRTSFRNPVSHKAKTTLMTRQQIEQTSGRRSGRLRELTDSPGSSYVTRTIRIFDKKGSGESKGVKLDKHLARDQKNDAGQQARSTYTSSQSAHEIDWERVFHQLRKKFDLKEEYADCLLLCRQCRCLFWKSFGHPCIKNDDPSLDQHCSGFGSFSQSDGMDNSNVNGNNRDRSNHLGELSSQQQQDRSSRRNGRQQAPGRVSVAALSRNFDIRAQRSADAENLPPQASSSSHPARPRTAPLNQRQSSDNLALRLRERNVRLANRRPLDSNNVNNAPPRSGVERNELVPMHVAISPQAFLKFFSL